MSGTIGTRTFAGTGHNANFLAALKEHPHRHDKIAAPKLDSFCHSKECRMNLKHSVAAICFVT